MSERYSDFSIFGVALFFGDKMVSFRICEDVHTTSEFLQDEIIIDRIRDIFEDMHSGAKTESIRF